MKNPAFSKDEQSLKITVRSIEKFSLLNTCAVLFQNRQLLFGGTQEPTQIIELRRCSLVRVGTLKFDYDSQSCTGWFGNLPISLKQKFQTKDQLVTIKFFCALIRTLQKLVEWRKTLILTFKQFHTPYTIISISELLHHQIMYLPLVRLII